MTAPVVERLTFYSHWLGFASPPSEAAKWTAVRDGEKFRWRVEVSDETGEFSAGEVEPLLTALDRPPVSELDPSLFGLPPSVIEGHYGSMWTDDHPEWHLGIAFADGRFVELSSDAQHAFMLPITVNDSAHAEPFRTFDPALAVGVAALLPDGFLNKERIGGRSGLLEYDLKRYTTPPEPEREPPAERPSLTPEEAEAAERKISDILFGVETATDKAKAERSGDISRRLLKRIPTSVALDLIARGANVNVADDVGQTALMQAAFPPFNSEKFRALVAAGANVHARRNDGMTGLLLACAGGESTAAEEWLWAGSDPHERDPDGCTPLIYAARWPRIVERLLAAGVEVNAVDNDGHSALANAVLQQCAVLPEREVEAMRLLLQAGADPNQPDRKGRTPTDHARRMLAGEELKIETLRAFRKTPADEPDSDFLLANVNHARALLELLVEFGGR